MNRPEQVVRAAVCGTAAVLVALLLTACGGGRAAPATITVTLGGGADAAAAAPQTTTAAAASVTQATVSATTPRSAALTRLRSVLAANAHRLGPGVGIAVEDLSTGQLLVSRDLDTGRAPASLEKLWTSAALLWRLGPGDRLQTQLYGRGRLAAGGVWHGNLYLRGDGDPTFGDGGWNRIYEDGYGPTAGELISDLKRLGIRRVSGHLFADASRFDDLQGGPMTDDKPDPGDYGGEMSALVYDHGLSVPGYGPAATAVHEVASIARLSGLRVYASRTLTATPGDARLLASLDSPPLSVMLRLMDVPSDDLFADLYAKQLGLRFFGHGNLLYGALAIRQTISAQYGLSPTLYDGSGLDRSDRSSPAQLLSLLRQLHGTPYGDIVRAALPVVGRTGTVGSIGLKTRAAGRCEAKTGTLDYVTNLAGYCTARNGDLLAFVFMVDGPDNGTSLVAFTPMVGAVANY